MNRDLSLIHSIELLTTSVGLLNSHLSGMSAQQGEIAGHVENLEGYFSATNTLQSATNGHLSSVVSGLNSVASSLNAIYGSTKAYLPAPLPSQSSGTLADATGLSATVVSGVTYEVSIRVIFQASNVLAGLKMGFSAPSGALSATAIVPNALTSALTGLFTTSATTITATTVGATSTSYIAVVEGVYQPTASGTLQVLTANGGALGSITVGAGSSIVLRRMN